jgi:hypothetical protein
MAERMVCETLDAVGALDVLVPDDELLDELLSPETAETMACSIC